MTDFSVVLTFCIGELIYYTIENYVLCYFVSNIINDTESIGDIAYNSPWNQMPRTVRVCGEMIIRRSHRPFELKGMGVFVCSLETFLKVRQWIVILFISNAECYYHHSEFFRNIFPGLFSWHEVPFRIIWCSVSWMPSNGFVVMLSNRQTSRWINVLMHNVLLHRCEHWFVVVVALTAQYTVLCPTDILRMIVSQWILASRIILMLIK